MPAERRLAFGSVAELYERARPSYPAALVDDVLEFCGGRGPALEVGAGTGKATRLFAARGIAVEAIEPSAEMAAIGQAACTGARFELTDFEHFDAGARRYRLLYCAQAWHWVAAEGRYEKARSLLEDGGAFALFWNRAAWEGNPLRDSLARAYREVVPDFGPLPGPMYPATNTPPELWGDWRDEVEAATGFGGLQLRAYRWPCEYTTEQYLEVIQTHSDHIVLGTERLGRLLDAVAAVIEGAGGRFELQYVTLLLLARAV
jgi:SAM-dependent methyltransferase